MLFSTGKSEIFRSMPNSALERTRMIDLNRTDDRHEPHVASSRSFKLALSSFALPQILHMNCSIAMFVMRRSTCRSHAVSARRDDRTIKSKEAAQITPRNHRIERRAGATLRMIVVYSAARNRQVPVGCLNAFGIWEGWRLVGQSGKLRGRCQPLTWAD